MRISNRCLIFGIIATFFCVSAHALVPPHNVPDFSADPTKPHISSVKTGNWSDTTTWNAQPPRLPNANDVVHINAAHEVTIDTVNAMAYTVAIHDHGHLKFKTDANTKLTVVTVLVMSDDYYGHTPGGHLEIGSEKYPILPHVAAEIVIRDVPLNTSFDPSQYGTGLIGFGQVTMHGAVKTPTFARLKQEPQDAIALALAEPVTGWQAGDALVLPDTRHFTKSEWRALLPTSGDGQAGFDKYKPKVAEWALQGNANSTTQLAVKFLRYPDGTAFNPANHRGAMDGTGVRFLPHVANLSRNVILRSENPQGTRGHVIFMHRADVDIRYARFKDLGRTRVNMGRTGFADATDPVTNRIGRYALHMHHVYGLNPPVHPHQFTLIGNTIDGALKWGITIHNTHFGLVRDNVMYNTGAAGIFTEDGPEYKNIIEKNFVVWVKGGNFDAKSNCVGKCLSDMGDLGDGFWFRGPMNIVRDNVAANVLRTGYIDFSAQRKSEDPAAVFDKGYLVVPRPKFPGANTTVAGEYDKINVGCKTFVEFARNEVYGATKVGFAFWSIGDHAANCSSSGALERNFVQDFRAWHIHGDGSFVYYVSDLEVDGWVQLGNPQVVNEDSVAIHWARTQRLYVQNADIQGHGYGVINRGRGASELFVLKDAYLKNRVNLLVRAWMQDPPSGMRETFMHNVTFAPQSNSPSQHAIEMRWDPPDSASQNVPDYVYVQNDNGPDSRVFYKEQQSNASIAGGNAGICSTTRPEITGYVCPWIIPAYDGDAPLE